VSPRKPRSLLIAVLLAGGLAVAVLVWLAGRGERSRQAAIALTDVTEEAGISFRHDAGAAGKLWNPETFGPGAGWLDFDGDGRQDLLLVNGSALEGGGDRGALPALYRNLGEGKFEDVTARAGLAVPIYGMGFISADTDGDGDQDVLIYGLHRSLYFRNDGRGRFREATESSGLAGLRGWVGAATFLDYDLDGKLDLFVGNYVDWSPAREEGADCTFGTGKKKYCPVAVFPPSAPQLYRGRGDGGFVETTEAAGIARLRGKALGVVVEDYDRDGDPDIFVANDSVPNFLLRNGGDGKFEDRGVESGFATGADGAAFAGMGIDSAWAPDGGPLLVAVGNFSGEPVTYYVQESTEYFIESSAAAGIAAATLDRVTFGLLLEDLDLDGRLDLILVNGHVFDVEDILRVPYRQKTQVFLGQGGGTFEEARPESPGHFLNRPIIGRALAACDHDGDGDLDLVATENQGAAVLLRNDLPGPHRFVRIDLRGTVSNRDALGAEVTLEAEGRSGRTTLRRTRKGSSSYLSQSDRRLTFGLAENVTGCTAEVRWPSGLQERFRDVPPGKESLLVEGTGQAAQQESPPAPSSRDLSAGARSVDARTRGLDHLKAGRLSDAARDLDEAIRLHPADLSAHRARLLALARAGRRTELDAAAREALAGFRDANVLVTHFAIVLREAGQVDLAARFFSEAASLDPRRVDVWLALGNIAFDRRAFDEALAHYARALELKPDSVEALANSGKVHVIRKDAAGAVPFLERALAIQPDSATALGSLGAARIEQGDFDRAEDLLTRAVAAGRARETLLSAWGNLGILHLKRRNRAKAIECFERVLELDPEDRQARAALERLRQPRVP
jgi:Tfp pilus assembly protein PilF